MKCCQKADGSVERAACFHGPYLPPKVIEPENQASRSTSAKKPAIPSEISAPKRCSNLCRMNEAIESQRCSTLR